MKVNLDSAFYFDFAFEFDFDFDFDIKIFVARFSLH